ncbi:helix-turn-helix domain-containing protein [Aromatoleum diolicum]|uniref:Helix-turn-helix domain-containing protein n=1 Tax=Aromatoleum diolicum TaxID=75796 RepID=A0ABX1Q5S6_9RHOO|nr:helix-turn-helix transcriptional regulator [Aromatoleum diolicum]NMG73717.1 helix-turn-helix domain-containing protein [Aromatoleum diolicum]
MPRYTTPRTLFGLRLREARLRAGIAQDKLGVLIGIDELSSSARISRYENGTHEPPFATAEKLAMALNVPTAFFYCEDEGLARLICGYALLPASKRDRLLRVLDELAEGAN